MQSRHNNTLPIRTFRIVCSPFGTNPNDIIQLTIAAMQRRIQTLELNLRVEPIDSNFVSNICTCSTLTFLKLKMLSFRGDIPLLSKNISQLKTLHLEVVYFDTHTDIINFLLSFPLLEELETNRVMTFGYKAADKIKCSLPNLVKAKLSDNKPIPLFLLSRVHTSLSIKLVSFIDLID
jgi:hypothetical protein